MKIDKELSRKLAKSDGNILKCALQEVENDRMLDFEARKKRNCFEDCFPGVMKR